jgi:hypothetical protein
VLVDAAELLPALVPVLEPDALPVPEPLAAVLEAVVLAEGVEGAGAFGAFACARSLALPQIIAAHTIPIAIFRLTLLRLSRTLYSLSRYCFF